MTVSPEDINFGKKQKNLSAIKFDNPKVRLLSYREWNPKRYGYVESSRKEMIGRRVADIVSTANLDDTYSMGAKLTRIFQMNPNMAPDIALSLARGSASNSAIDAVNQALTYQNLSPLFKPEAPRSGEDENVLFSLLKGGVKYGLSGLMATWDTAAGTIREKVASAISLMPEDSPSRDFLESRGFEVGQRVEDKSLLQKLESVLTIKVPFQAVEGTELYQMVFNDEVDSGTGFLPSSEVVRAAEKVARQTLKVHGKGFTLGRGFAATVIEDPDSTAYNVVSGTIDAVAAIFLDPTVITGKIAAGAKLARRAAEAAEAGTSARIATGVPQIVDIAKRQKGIAELSLKEADQLLNAEYSALSKAYAEADELFMAGKFSTGRTGSDIAFLRTQYKLDDLTAKVDDLTNKLNLIRQGDTSAVANAVLNKRGREYILAEVKRTSETPEAVLARLGLDFLEKEKFIVTNADEVAKRAESLVTRQLNTATKKLVDAQRKVYGSSDTALLNADQIKEINASILIRQRVLQQRKEVVREWAERVRNPWEKYAFIERNKAGLKSSTDEMKINREKALDWFAQGNADFAFEALAKIDSPAQINRLTRGKWGLELSRKIADAQTADEVEALIIRNIGGNIDSALTKGQLGRLTVAADPAASIPVRKFGTSGYLNARYQAMFGRYATTDQKIAGRKFIHFDDVDDVALSVERWMKMAKVPQGFRDEITNALAETYRIENVLERNGEIFKIVTSALTKAGEIASQGVTNQYIRAAIARATKAYASSATDFKTYRALRDASASGDTLIYQAGDELRIADSAVGIADFADGIVLPNIREFQNLTGKLARSVRYLDEKLGTPQFKIKRSAVKKGLFEKVAVDTFKEFTDFFFDDVLRTSLLVFRTAYVIRNIGEMQVRQALSQRSLSAFENPLAAIAMVMSDTKTANNWLTKTMQNVGKYDPYVVDINGRAFYDTISDKAQDVPQELLDAMARAVSNRAAAMDGRAYSFASGQFGRINLLPDRSNQPEFVEGMVGELLRFRSDPIRRAVAKGELPPSYAKAVANGAMTYEEAFVRALAKGKIKGVPQETYNALVNGSEKLRSLLKGSEENRIKFFLGDGVGSYEDEITRITLGNNELRQFIATGKLDNFVMSPDGKRNFKGLSKIVDDYLTDDEMFKRAQSGNMLSSIANEGKGKLNIRGAVDFFFDIAAAAEKKVVYGPEFRVAYWAHVMDMAPFMTADAAKKILANTEDIIKTRIVINGKEIPLTKHFDDKWKALEKAQNNTEGIYSFDDVQKFATSKAAKHVSEMFYASLEQDRWAYGLRLLLPFVAAWENTARKWAQLSSTTYGLSRVEQASRTYQTLQSEETGVLYDVMGMKRYPNQGFIYENNYGEKVFRIPFSGLILGAFMGDKDMADIESTVQSLNLLFAGGNIPGTDVGFLPGVGQSVQLPMDLILSDDQWNSLPEWARAAVSPYGQPDANALVKLLPAWSKNLYYALGRDEDVIAMAQPIMNYKLSSDPKYMPLLMGGISAGERRQLQLELTQESYNDARKMYLARGILQSALPSTPIMNFYATTKEGSFSQVQLQRAFNKMFDDSGQDWNTAVVSFAETFGDNSLPILINGYNDTTFGTMEAWNFGNDNKDIMAKYGDVLQYFFPKDGVISAEYAKAMRRRKGLKRLSLAEVLKEADALTASLVRNRLTLEAADNGYDDQWISEQYKLITGEKFKGWDPGTGFNPAVRKNKLQLIREAIDDDRMNLTPVGPQIIKFMTEYDRAVAAYRAATGSSNLSNIGAARYRVGLESLARDLSQENPDFKWVYNSLFAPELEG